MIARRRLATLAGAAVLALSAAFAARSARALPEQPKPVVRPVARTVAPNAPHAPHAPNAPIVAKRPEKVAAITIEREVYSYGGTGRRDPFKSLLTTTALRPMLPELRLVAVAYDPTGGASVAILRDVNSKVQHRVRVGTPLGRMRVAAIRQKSVVFTIEELGYSRQETLGLNDSTAVRSK
jgi:hypothetical protein